MLDTVLLARDKYLVRIATLCLASKPQLNPCLAETRRLAVPGQSDHLPRRHRGPGLQGGEDQL
jgi:hypothetical protein